MSFKLKSLFGTWTLFFFLFLNWQRQNYNLLHFIGIQSEREFNFIWMVEKSGVTLTFDYEEIVVKCQVPLRFQQQQQSRSISTKKTANLHSMRVGFDAVKSAIDMSVVSRHDSFWLYRRWRYGMYVTAFMSIYNQWVSNEIEIKKSVFALRFQISINVKRMNMSEWFFGLKRTKKKRVISIKRIYIECKMSLDTMRLFDVVMVSL